jgi:AcrR family transcriptional regulator
LSRKKRGVGGHGKDRDLSPRVRPVQQRAKDTVDLILDNAASLLQEVGVDAFNTNLLAESAGVAVRSVYRYYPNKLAVIVALAERQAREWQEIFTQLLVPLADPDEDPFQAWDAVLDAYASYIEGKDGRSAIHRAMQALPQLAEVNRQDNDVLADAIAAALRGRGVDEPRSRLSLIARILLDTQDVAVDEALSRRGRVPIQLLTELKLMHRSYLVRFVD